MITLSNYNSGELEIQNEAGHKLHLPRESANRLIMMARMHTVAEFVEKLPSLIPDEKLLQSIQSFFEGKTPTERWNLKEKFARLTTLAKGYEPKKLEDVIESVTLP